MIDVVIDELIKISIEYGRKAQLLELPTTDDEAGRRHREEVKAQMAKYEHQMDILSLCIKERVCRGE